MNPDVPVWLPFALAAAAFVAWRSGRMLVAACLVAVLAAVLGLLPRLLSEAGVTGGGTGGPLASGAPVPAAYRPWIEQAGSRCPDITPAVLAAQLSQESGFNPAARGAAGEKGMAQFMPATWESWAADGDGNGTASPFDPADAITAQGAFMCHLAAAARDGLAAGRLHGGVTELALAGYNAGFGAVQRAGGLPPIASTRSYVRSILAAATTYTTSPAPGVPA